MTEKLKMQSMDKVQYNIEKIREMFPNAVTEVKRDEKTELAVDFDVLKQELTDTLIDERELRYHFTWPDKQKSILLANTPVAKTLRPDKEKSVDFDNTQNLYIEGDNLDVLKLLRETYLNKIKMIYIDPPYNTGNDFVYEDDFALEGEEYKYGSGQYDEVGNRLFQNTESNGRFHTDWLNMIYPRLKVAKDLLSDDGVIFISIDDNEQANLKKICDEVFGESNFINNFMWLHGKGKKDSQSRTLQQYMLCYTKNKISLPSWKDEKYTAYEFQNPDNDPKGKWFSGSISFDENRSNPKHPNFYTVTSPSGICWTRQWQISREEMNELIEQGDIFWGEAPAYCKVPRKKIRPSTIEIIPGNIFEDCGTTKSAEKEIKNIFGRNVFEYPKPVDLIRKIIKIAGIKDMTILDFFSGSATTAHAVMQLNAEDGGNRKFIMVQLPEPCDEKSEAYKAGYKTICDIGEERIRRAGQKIIEEKAHLTNAVKSGAFQLRMAYAEFTTSSTALKTQEEIKKNLDIGFRVLRLDSSNMREVYYHPEQYTQTLLDDLTDNIKEDRTPLDLLFQVMLDLGVKPSAKIEEKEIAGKRVFVVNENELLACFDGGITDEVVKAIAKMQPLYAAFRDSSYASDSVAANFEQIFATYSPKTRKEVL